AVPPRHRQPRSCRGARQGRPHDARGAGSGARRPQRSRAERHGRAPPARLDLRQQRGHRRPWHAAEGWRRGRDHPGSRRARMLITAEELAAIKRQAIEESSNECCGVILVRGAERRHVPCRNVQDQMHARDPMTFPRTARNAYYMDPLDALRLNRLVDEGFAFAVIYHSHPNAGAYFSETDRAQALIKGEPAYPGAVYVVVSVVGRQARAVSAYRWNIERRVFERADDGDLDSSDPSTSPRCLPAAAPPI